MIPFLKCDLCKLYLGFMGRFTFVGEWTVEDKLETYATLSARRSGRLACLHILICNLE